MNNNKVIKSIIVSGISMLIIDYFYLTTIGKYFDTLVTKIQGYPIKFNIIGAILCYIVLIASLNYFVLLNNNLTSLQKYRDAFILGLTIYAVFELTNIAIFDKWTWLGVLIDSVWGSILFFVVTLITINLIKK